jgi:hypothetical protein
MAKKNKTNPYAGMTADQIIAATDADVRYGGQLTQIKDLYRQAAKQKKSDIGAARETAASTIAYANAQRPTIKDVYRRGAQQADKTSAGVNAVLTRSLGADSPYAAEIAAETGGSKNRINEAKIGALTDLTNRATGAVAGRAAAINQARAAYRENKTTLGTKLSDLLGEKGAYVAGRLATLGADAADAAAANERANTVIASGALTGKTQNWVKNHPQQAADLVDKYNKAHPPGGVKKPTTKGTDRALKFSDAVNRAAPYAQKGFDQGFNRKDVQNALVQGHVLETGEKGQPTPAFGSLAAQAAADIVYDGHISRYTANALHKYGYKVKDIQNAISSTDFVRRQLREPKADPSWQAKNRVAYTDGDWLAKLRAATGLR